MYGKETIYGKILVPVHADRDMAARNYAMCLARASGGTIFLLTIGEDDSKSTYAEKAAQQCRSAGVVCEVVFRRGELPKMIIQVAEELAADVIILVHRGDSRHVSKILNDPSTGDGIRHFPCPMMIVPSFVSAPGQVSIPETSEFMPFSAETVDQRAQEALESRHPVPPSAAEKHQS